MCVWAPPFDQEPKAYVRDTDCCGEMALTVFVEPTITVRVSGVGAWIPPTATWRPVGAVANVRLTVCGWMSTLSVSVEPLESVAVSRSSR